MRGYELAVGACFAIAALGACATLRTVSRTIEVKDRVVVAHRGAHGRAPENSLASIREARALGIDMVELDVRTTRDGALVLLHDETVDRTTNGTGAIAELEASAVHRLVLDAPDAAFAGERLPFLAEALALAARGREPGIYLHVKEAEPEAIARAIRAAPEAHVLVFQEDREWLEHFHEIAPGIAVLPLTEGGQEGVHEVARALGARTFAFDEPDFTPQAARAAHAIGGRVLVDVLGGRNVEARVLEALENGADGVQTDEPERVLALLGRWRG